MYPSSWALIERQFVLRRDAVLHRTPFVRHCAASSRLDCEPLFGGASTKKSHLLPFSTLSSPELRQLHLASQMGEGEKAESILKQMIENTRHRQGSNTAEPVVDPSAISLALTAWMKSSEEAMAAERAHSLLERMRILSLQKDDTESSSSVFPHPSPQDFHNVLRCWSKPLPKSLAGQAAKRADQLLNTMSEIGGDWQPSADTYTSYLSVLSNAGEASRAQKCLHGLFEEYSSFLSSKDTESETENDGLPPSQPTLAMGNAVLAAWGKLHSYSAAEQAEICLKQMHRHSESGVLAEPPNLNSFNLVFDCWSNAARASSKPNSGKDLHRAASRAQALWDTMKEAGIHPNAVTYNSMISVLARAGIAEAAERALTQLILDYSAQFDADLKPSIKPFQNVLLAWSKSRHPHSAERAGSFLKHMSELHDAELLDTQPDVYSYNIVLHCWAQSGQSGRATVAGEQALELLEHMQDHEVTPDTTSINCVLNAWANCGKAKEAEALLWQFYEKHLEDPRNNPQPNKISFTTVLKAWSRSKSPEALDKVSSLFSKLQEMSDLGWQHCKPDVVTCAIVIDSWAKSKRKGAASQAEAILRRMQDAAKAGDAGTQPDTVCWNSVINAWAHEGNGERAEGLLQEMFQGYKKGEHTAKPNLVTFSAVLSSWAKDRYNPEAPARAEQVLEAMYNLYNSGVLQVKPNVISYSIVLDCLAHAKRTWAAQRAESILRHMSISGDRDIRPNVVSYNSVIKAWSFTHDPQAVPRVTALLAELVDQAEDDPKMRPRIQTFGSVLKTIANSRLQGKAKRADAVVLMMQKYDLEPTEWCIKQLRKCQQDDARVRN